MENNQSGYKYKGFKFVVIAMLFAGATWFSFFSNDMLQTDDQRAELRGAHISMMNAGSIQQVENPLTKLRNIDERIVATTANPDIS